MNYKDQRIITINIFTFTTKVDDYKIFDIDDCFTDQEEYTWIQFRFKMPQDKRDEIIKRSVLAPEILKNKLYDLTEATPLRFSKFLFLWKICIDHIHIFVLFSSGFSDCATTCILTEQKPVETEDNQECTTYIRLPGNKILCHKADLAPKEKAASEMRNRHHVQPLLTWSTNAAHPVSLDQEPLQGDAQRTPNSTELVKSFGNIFLGPKAQKLILSPPEGSKDRLVLTQSGGQHPPKRGHALTHKGIGVPSTLDGGADEISEEAPPPSRQALDERLPILGVYDGFYDVSLIDPQFPVALLGKRIPNIFSLANDTSYEVAVEVNYLESYNASAFVIKTGSTTQWHADLAPKEMAASDMRNRCHCAAAPYMEYKHCSSCIPGLGALTGYYQPGQLNPGFLELLETIYFEEKYDIIQGEGKIIRRQEGNVTTYFYFQETNELFTITSDDKCSVEFLNDSNPFGSDFLQNWDDFEKDNTLIGPSSVLRKAYLKDRVQNLVQWSANYGERLSDMKDSYETSRIILTNKQSWTNSNILFVSSGDANIRGVSNVFWMHCPTDSDDTTVKYYFS
ncbi:hypothetical protein LAZ67_15002722, partial [Cordylochernes scorpioides]